MHNSNLNYKHRLQCAKVVWKITCVSLGEFLGHMQELGMKFKHLGVLARPERLRNLVFLIPINPKHAWKSWNLAWCHDMAPPCCGNFFLPNWDKLWCKLLANRSFPQDGSWYREGTCHLHVRNDIRTLPSPALNFLNRKIRPNRRIVLNFGIIPGSFGLFYTLIEFLGI